MAETTLVSSLFECVTNDFYKIRKKNNKYSKNEFHSRYFRTWFYSMSELFAKNKQTKKKIQVKVYFFQKQKEDFLNLRQCIEILLIFGVHIFK